MKTSVIRITTLIKKFYPTLSSDRILALILSGQVYAGDEKITSQHALVSRKAVLRMEMPAAFVSRGGDKLAPIIRQWGISVKDKVCLDAGCSTGGFTDCLLQGGARLVHAVDVGYNQLAYSLRTDPRVRVLERTNIRDLKPGVLEPQPELAVCDLSFRSLRGVAGGILELVQEKLCLALVKPQFEYRNPPEEFDGVVRDDNLLLEILISLCRQLTAEGVCVSRCAFSPVKGRKGNREVFFLLTRQPGVEPGARSAVGETELRELIFAKS